MSARALPPLIAMSIVLTSLFAVSIQPSVAHYWVPRYDGSAWGKACLRPAPGLSPSPADCCKHSRMYCRAACGLTAEVGEAWKQACRNNCDAAGASCLSWVQNPPTGVGPRWRPPVSPN